MACLLSLSASGCATTVMMSPTRPTGVTQQLVIRALERALARLDLSRLKGRAASVAVAIQAGNQAFVEKFVAAWVEAHGVRVTAVAPDVRLKVFASVLGTDHGETLIGIPSFQVPLVGLPVPEIAFFKWVRDRGEAEVRLYAFDARSDAVLETPAPAVGRSKYDSFTVLIVIAFSVTDVDKPGG